MQLLLEVDIHPLCLGVFWMHPWGPGPPLSLAGGVLAAARTSAASQAVCGWWSDSSFPTYPQGLQLVPGLVSGHPLLGPSFPQLFSQQQTCGTCCNCSSKLCTGIRLRASIDNCVCSASGCLDSHLSQRHSCTGSPGPLVRGHQPWPLHISLFWIDSRVGTHPDAGLQCPDELSCDQQAPWQRVPSSDLSPRMAPSGPSRWCSCVHSSLLWWHAKASVDIMNSW